VSLLGVEPWTFRSTVRHANLSTLHLAKKKQLIIGLLKLKNLRHMGTLFLKKQSKHSLYKPEVNISQKPLKY